MYFIGGSEGASGRVLEDEATLIGGLLTSPVGRMELDSKVKIRGYTPPPPTKQNKRPRSVTYPRQDREESA